MKKTVCLMMLALVLLLNACAKGEVSCYPAEEPKPSAAEEQPSPMLADGEETAPEEMQEETEEEPIPLDPTCGEIPLPSDESQDGYAPQEETGEADPMDPLYCGIHTTGDVPPTLYVVAGGKTFQFESGNYTWTGEVQADGTQSSVIACGVHPLQVKPEEILLVEAGGVIRIWFDVDPEKITGRCWEERFWGDAENGEPNQYAVEIVEGTIMPIDNLRYAYEVTASWGEGCKASYVFFAVTDAVPSE